MEDQIDKVELWKVAHKQRKGKKRNLGVEQALVGTVNFFHYFHFFSDIRMIM